MGAGAWIILLSCVIVPLSAQDENGSADFTTTDDSIVNEQEDGNLNIEWESWYPKVNATCRGNKLQIADNPGCFGGKLNQTTTQCKSGSECRREIVCSSEQACSPWTRWLPIEKCNGTTIDHTRRRACDNVNGEGCDSEVRSQICIEGRSNPRFPIDGNQDEKPKSGSQPTQALIFGVVGVAMVGLLAFAVLRIRKATGQKQEPIQETRDRDVDGVDNEALMTVPSDSRVQEILNNMNANGHHYELRERSDSTPGRRVYVISPAGSQSSPTNQRGRIFSRATSQLSSIAEETADDALSRITEATEPLEDDCIFKYDCDSIDRLENADSAFEEEPSKPASSTEAINCINDVIAMYDVDNQGNIDINEIMKRNSMTSQSDFRKSTHEKGDEYLSDFGWSPQERKWTIAKLKDGDTTTDRRISASCSTLNSMYLSNMSIASKGTTSDGAVSDENFTDPLLRNSHGSMSNLEQMKAFSSMPTILDTSQIPDIDQVLSNGQKKN